MRFAALVLVVVACGPTPTSDTEGSYAPPSSKPAPAAPTASASSLTSVERCLLGTWTDQSGTDTTRQFTYKADHTYDESMIYSPLIGTGTGYDKTGKWQLSGGAIAISFSGGDSQVTELSRFRTLNAPRERDASDLAWKQCYAAAR